MGQQWMPTDACGMHNGVVQEWFNTLQTVHEKEIILPTAQPTSCAFVGSHLLITTASIGLEEDSFAGLTFLIPVGVEVRLFRV